MSDICAVCQFCTYEDGRPPEAYCHNQYKDARIQQEIFLH